MTTLTVGSNQQFATIAAAVAATQDGDTVLIQAGTYTNDFFTTTHKITLQSQGGLAVIQATAAPSNGKGIITADNDLTLIGIGLTGAAVNDANGAGIRYEAGNLTVRNSVFWNNQDGILATPLVAGTGTIVISGSEFAHNGAGDGYSHNIYIGTVASLSIDSSYIHDALVGHEVKSRAYSTTITNSRIQDNASGTASYDVDLPNGGVALLQNDVIEKGPAAANPISIHFGGEGTPYANSSLTVTGSTLLDDNPNGYLVGNQTTITASVTNNALYNYPAARLSVGPVTFTNNTTLGTEPTLNTTTRVPTPTLPPDPSTGTALHNWGSNGAVVATGHILAVGTLSGINGQFATIQQALNASIDGDTIQVAAGTYVNNYADINHKVIIQGVGGVARFVQSPGQVRAGGLFVANTDVTIQNVDLSGATNAAGNEAGLYVSGGNVTLVNSALHDNDIGLAAAANTATNLAVYTTDIVHNGNASSGVNGIQVNRINGFTLQNSLVSGTLSGHELSSQAFNNDIENDRIIDGPTAPASFLIDLGAGGNDTVRNNLLVKGANAANGVLVHVGGEAAPYANSAATISANTLVSQLVNPAHPNSYFIVGDPGKGLPPVTAANNSFAGAAPGSVWLTNASDAGGNVAAASPATINTASATSAATIPSGFTSPDPLFDAAYYLLHNPDVAAAGVDPYLHYLTFGWKEGRDPSALFDTRYYLTQNPDVKAAAVDPLLHFEQYGWKEGRQPSLLFDDAKYLAANPTVQAAGINPLQDYMQHSQSRIAFLTGGTAPADLLVNAVTYDQQLGATLLPTGAAAAQQAAWSYDNGGWQRGLNPDTLFDTTYYLSRYPDVAAAHVDPLLHYETFGWKEGRDPSAAFSTNKYIAAYSDIRAAYVDPLLHYVTYGQSEGRSIFPVT